MHMESANEGHAPEADKGRCDIVALMEACQAHQHTLERRLYCLMDHDVVFLDSHGSIGRRSFVANASVVESHEIADSCMFRID